jgi:hypothetical protein
VSLCPVAIQGPIFWHRYYGNSQLRITQYQHPSFGIIHQNKNPYERFLVGSGQASVASGPSILSTSSNARRQSRDATSLDELNDLNRTQVENDISFGFHFNAFTRLIRKILLMLPMMMCQMMTWKSSSLKRTLAML